MKKFLPLLIMMSATLAYAKTINVADHGIVPGKDVTFELNELVASVKGDEAVTLSFPKGQYELHPENALEMYRSVANHDNGLKRMAFPLLGHKNITIDGNGSMFMFHGRLIPFTIVDAENVTLKNLSVNWIRSFHAELVVVEANADENSFVVEIDPVKYPHEIKDREFLFERYGQKDRLGSNMLWLPETRSPIYDTRSYGLGNGAKGKIKDLGNNRYKLTKATKKTPPVGSIFVVYGTHPTSRFNHVIQIVNSKDIHIENVTIHEGGGMGLIAENTENITLNGMVVTSAEDRIVSTRADATHFIGCKGTIKVENCLFEHMLDDAINVHGAYVPVERYMGDNQFLCEISHFQQWGFVFGEPGDDIALLSRTTILPFHNTTIKDIKILNEHRFILTVADVPESLPEGPLSVENLTGNPDLVMRKNIIRENRARSVLVTTKGKVTIEDNYFNSQMHGILIEGDNNWWYESGAVQDVTIRNNVFENIGFAKTERYPLLCAPLLKEDQKVGEESYHRNVKFVDNTIKSFNGLLVKAFYTEGLTISGNKVTFSTDYPAADEGPSVVLESCNQVTIENNSFNGFGKPQEISTSDDSSEVNVANNTGLN